MVFVLVAVGFLGCLLTMEKVSNPVDGDVRKKKKTRKKKTQNKTQGLQRIKKMRKKRNKTSVCLLFPSDMFYVRRCL